MYSYSHKTKLSPCRYYTPPIKSGSSWHKYIYDGDIVINFTDFPLRQNFAKRSFIPTPIYRYSVVEKHEYSNGNFERIVVKSMSEHGDVQLGYVIPLKSELFPNKDIILSGCVNDDIVARFSSLGFREEPPQEVTQF